ncbi:uncharacterized protein LOC142095485 [Mixophyes fleayi]|uniref:uncharacterized protein LOC142095485 n=1 Tax=Mixophyes fleayi TaxID=3061075 RepID=UPI003F4DD2DA
MILDQGFSKAETLSVQNYLKGIWYITFASIAICKRYWEAVKTARPESPFSRFVGNCPIQREERRVTVSMRNPHTPGKDIATFLSRFCSVVKDPSKILDANGFWTGKWSIIIRLRKDSTATDGLQHLPSSFALGGSAGLLHYADQPRNCRKCGEADHMARSCKVPACRNCKVAGHDQKLKTARPESPFSRFVGNCPIQREERRVTVSMRNPHTPGKDIATFLSRFCSVVKDPSKILDVNGFWTGKWSIIIRLRKDSTATDGLQHLPSSFALGGSAGLLHYADQPRNCRKCGEADHMARSCKVSACRNCKVAGHESKDCPRKLSCNLCGLASHIYRDCPQRARSYAAAAGIGLPESGPAPALQPKPAQRKQQKPTPQPRAGKISPTPVVTAPPSLPAVTTPPPPAVALTPSTATAAPSLSLEDFPPLLPLVSAGDENKQRRKRKELDSPAASESPAVTMTDLTSESPVVPLHQTVYEEISSPGSLSSGEDFRGADLVSTDVASQNVEMPSSDEDLLSGQEQEDRLRGRSAADPSLPERRRREQLQLKKPSSPRDLLFSGRSASSSAEAPAPLCPVGGYPHCFFRPGKRLPSRPASLP